MSDEAFSANGHKRAVIYARVSSDDTKNDGRNLKSQIEMGREYCRQHGYTVIAELSEDDRGASGASFELPRLGAALAMAERGEYDIFVVREIDRLSRNLAKQLIVEEELRRAGVVIDYVLGEYPDSPEGNLNKHIRATIAEFEREKIRERNTRGRRNVVKNGRIMLHGNNPPYGYRLSEDGKNLIVYEPEARIIQMVFDWYTKGDEDGKRLSAFAIAGRLSEMQVPTWCDVYGKRKKLAAGKWTDTSILYMLSSETYAGRWYYGRQKGRGGLNPREHWILLDVPAIIDPAQWEAAKEMRQQNMKTSSRNLKKDYLLRLRVKGNCNYALRCAASYVGGKLYLYYAAKGRVCTVRHGCAGCGLCFRADHVDALVWNWLKGYFKDPADLRNKLEAYQQERARVNAPIIAMLRTNEDLIASNQVQLDRIKNMCQAGVITMDEAVERKTRLADTVIKLEREHGKLTARLSNELSQGDIEDIITFAYTLSTGLDEADKSFEKRRRIIDLLDVNCILAIEGSEKVVYASFVLTKGERGERLVLPKRGRHSFLSFAPMSLHSGPE